MSSLKNLRNKHLVSLNTARRKLRNGYPKISQELEELLEMLKTWMDSPEKEVYESDGFLSIDK